MPKMNHLILIVVSLFLQQQAGAWGERGHHTICEVATQLIQNTELADFMKGRSHMMGHVCNIPDIHWRRLGDVAKSGDETHFLNPENIDESIENLSTDLNKIIEEKEGKYSQYLKRNIHVMTDLGSLWWRYDQFSQRALIEARNAKIFSAEESFLNDPKKKEEYINAIFSMLTNMGEMGHFVADASQPYHNTADYDGWKSQRGGIHSYYETKVVNELPLNIQQKVYEAAVELRLKNKDLANLKTAMDRIRYVSVATRGDLEKIKNLDPILSPSENKENPDGAVQKTPAKRKKPSEVAKSFESLIVSELALSAVALADTWDQIYSDAQWPHLKSYNSYNYPLAPDFVAPSYGDKKTSRAKKK